MPEPTADQAFNLSICFDLVEHDAAEVLILLNVCGLEVLSRVREQRGNQLPPVVTLDKSLTAVSDVYFHVGDPDLWSEVAERLISFRRTSQVTEKASACFRRSRPSRPSRYAGVSKNDGACRQRAIQRAARAIFTNSAKLL